jgi:hypothetical protein
VYADENDIVKINEVHEAIIHGKLIVAKRYCALYENGMFRYTALWTLPDLLEFMKVIVFWGVMLFSVVHR